VDHPLRVLICDDSLGFPALVRAWLNNDDRFTVVGLAHGGEEAQAMVAASHPDLLVLDFMLPDVADPATLVSALRVLHPALRIVMISSLRMEELRSAARSAGVDGVCNKAATAQELTDALYAAAGAAGSSTQNLAP
jgi:two-component system capsular synthesis response regulator RcsB